MYLENIFLSAQNKTEVSYAVHYAARDAPVSLRATSGISALYHLMLPYPLLPKYPRNSGYWTMIAKIAL